MSYVLSGLAALLILAALVIRLRSRYLRVTVVGRSMAPTFAPGDRILVRRAGLAQLHVGDVIVFREAGGSLLLKRLVAMPGDRVPGPLTAKLGADSIVPLNSLLVLGDATERGNDSTHFGYLPAQAVVGIAARNSARAATTFR
jgi:signal peptidase I